MAMQRHVISPKHIVGSKWTTLNPIQGWLHFHVITWTPDTKMVELRASCDKLIQFWVLKSDLENRELWQPGWKIF